ncbi:MAG: CrcB family protein [Actinobacteria bacterium]|nr:CrcB family protein [Actinomycetota bacterium]
MDSVRLRVTASTASYRPDTLGSYSWSGALGNHLWDLAAVGLLGGFTTASTSAYEAVRLGEEGRIKTAIGQSAFTFVAALSAAALSATIFGP